MSPTGYQHSKLQTNFRGEKPILLQKCCDGFCMIVTSSIQPSIKPYLPYGNSLPHGNNISPSVTLMKIK
jgi:hypothetical protein